MPIRIHHAAIAAITATLSTMPAYAETAEPAGYASASRMVRIADLDLREDGDVARLHRRIQAAATAVCGRPDPRNLAMMSKIRRCQDETVNSASRRVETIIAAVRTGTDQRMAVRESLRMIAR